MGFRISLWIGLCAVLLVAPHADAMTARAYGMGGAFTAVADDLGALYYNPAGLNQTPFGLQFSVSQVEPEAMAQMSDLVQQLEELSRLEDPTAAGSIEGRGMTTARGLIGADIGPLSLGLVIEEMRMSIDLQSESYEYNGEELSFPEGDVESVMSGSGGAALTGRIGPVATGIFGREIRASSSVQSMQFEPDENDPANTRFEMVEEGMTGIGRAFDIGVLVPLPFVRLGAVVRNLGGTLEWSGERRTTYQYPVKDTESETTEPLQRTEAIPPSFRIGAATTVPIIGATVAADLAPDGVRHVGAEKHLLFNLFSLRAGAIFSDAERRLTGGLGINLGPLHANVAAGSSDGFQTYDAAADLSLIF